jgi:hypothetical protein
MTSKTEEKIRKMLDDQIQEQINVVNDQMSGTFLYGVVVGLILSYSGILGYVAGVGSGILIARKYTYISHQISTKSSYLFSNIVTQLSNDININKNTD